MQVHPNIGASQCLPAPTTNSACSPTCLHSTCETAVAILLNSPEEHATVATVDEVLSSYSDPTVREFGQPAKDSSDEEIFNTPPSSVNSSDNECVSID